METTGTKLNQWERMAIETALEAQIASGKIHEGHGEALLERLRGARHIQLGLPKQ